MLTQQLVNGLVVGSMYALIAVGMTLYFGILNIINLAHGGIYMLGAFAALVVAWSIGDATIPVPISISLILLGAAVFCGVVGVAVAFTAKPLRKAPPLMFLIMSLGMYIVFEEAVLIFFPDGANPQIFHDPFELKALHMGDAIVGYVQIFLVVLTFLVITALHLIISRTSFGRSIRALTADATAAEMVGINVDRTLSLTFFMGSVLAAIGGVLDGMNSSTVMFNMGFLAAIKGFTAAAIGGLGNVYGALVGGYLLGMIEVLASAYLPSGSAYKDVVGFGILILCLTFRPAGLFGRTA